MENESKKLEIAKVVLGAAFAVVMVGISFGLGWYAKELAVVKQSQRELQVVIEDVQDDTEQMRGKIAAVEQEQLKLRAEIKDVENNMEELVGNIAETIERNQLKLQGMIEDVRNNTQELVAGMAETVQRSQLELHDAIENVRKNTRQIAGKVAAIEQNQLEFQGLIKQISKQVLPGDSLEVISVEPACPAVLDLGEKLRVKVRYRVVSSDSVRIWVRPYTRGRRTSGYKAHGSSTYEKGTGVVEGYFFFEEPVMVDEVRVKMVDSKTHKTLNNISYKVDARWFDPNSINEIRGETVIHGTFTWDIDKDAIPGGRDSDVWWEQVDSRVRYLVPINGAKVCTVSDCIFEKIDMGYLTKLRFSDEKISGSDDNSVLVPGTVIALRSSEGNLAKMRVIDIGKLSSRSRLAENSLKVEWVLYQEQRE